MKNALIMSAAGLALLALSFSTATADRKGCRDAAEAYKSAKRDVADNLQSYADCIHSSDGRDDCSAEFARLKSAQDDFETAVSDYDDQCK